MSDDVFEGLDPIKDVPIAPAHGIAAIALSMALKYHNMTVIKDGAMYQQYKLEGKNMRPMDLDLVFETSMKIELYLLSSSKRIAGIVIDALEFGVKDDEHPPQTDDPRMPEKDPDASA